MRKIISAAEMREIDRLTTEQYATPSILLMEAAASASARAIAARLSSDLAHKTIRVLCGRGNNGGDGAALARALWMMGARADVVLFGRADETRGDARTNFEMVRRLASYRAGSNERPSGLSFVECETTAQWEEIAGAHHGYDVIVDALFGTGLARPLEGVHREVAAHLTLMREARENSKQTGCLFVSLDIPSGLNADSADPLGDAVRADMTVTFTSPKPANVLPPASRFGGELVVADIGSPPSLIDAAPSKLFLTEADDARAWLEKTRYAPGSHKYSHGHVLVVAGSWHYTGAPALCANAAMRSGVGMVTLASPATAHDAIAPRLLPEIISSGLPETDKGAVGSASTSRIFELAERATVVAVGPGLTSDSEETRALVREIVARRRTPVVIDADGLNALAPWPQDLRGSRELPLVLTPHEGELRRLLGADARAPIADKTRAVGEFASAHQLIVVLKGERALVAAPDGRVFVNPTGNAGLGRAGSGDTLTGVVAGFVAQAFATPTTERDAGEATVAAVYVAGLAGDLAARERGLRALTASDVREHLGAAMRALDPKGERP
ncbi:MAG TPA: NAD(P)H-hydrate dehydratase [Pyrinomonadaceae bacterium]|nr:NAD(P)H-hydrate dehydratase [Pyrinomonadaceae bacterium]